MNKRQLAEREEHAARLREMLSPGDTVYTVLRHRSKSGMSRRIDLFVIEDGEPTCITYAVAKACDYRVHQDGGLVVHGCGMDMGFAVVYELGCVLFPEGFGVEGKDSLGRKCKPKSKMGAMEARNKGFEFRGRNGDASGWDDDGGYALKQRWL